MENKIDSTGSWMDEMEKTHLISGEIDNKTNLSYFRNLEEIIDDYEKLSPNKKRIRKYGNFLVGYVLSPASSCFTAGGGIIGGGTAFYATMPPDLPVYTKLIPAFIGAIMTGIPTSAMAWGMYYSGVLGRAKYKIFNKLDKNIKIGDNDIKMYLKACHDLNRKSLGFPLAS